MANSRVSSTPIERNRIKQLHGRKYFIREARSRIAEHLLKEAIFAVVRSVFVPQK